MIGRILSTLRRLKAAFGPETTPLTGEHARAIAQSYGRVRSDDAAGIERLTVAADALQARYGRSCDFHVEAEIDPSWTSIYADTADEWIALPPSVTGLGVYIAVKKEVTQ